MLEIRRVSNIDSIALLGTFSIWHADTVMAVMVP
jgi:hypothetical protein